jgi:hypothetical protein
VCAYDVTINALDPNGRVMYRWPVKENGFEGVWAKGIFDEQ